MLRTKGLSKKDRTLFETTLDLARNRGSLRKEDEDTEYMSECNRISK